MTPEEKIKAEAYFFDQQVCKIMLDSRFKCFIKQQKYVVLISAVKTFVKKHIKCIEKIGYYMCRIHR